MKTRLIARDDPSLANVMFSEHSLERFVHRTCREYQRHVKLCWRHKCKECELLFREAKKRLREDRIVHLSAIQKRFGVSHEIFDYDKRNKADRYFRHGDILFIVSMQESIPIVLTCYDLRHKGQSIVPVALTGNRIKR